MNYFFKKNKIKTIREERSATTKQAGFVALFAVLVSSILLLMALSISGIAYKEQLLSVNAKTSQYSFMAADTGMECALYWDVNRGWFTSGQSPDDQTVKCGGVHPTYLLDVSSATKIVYKLDVNANVNGNTIPGCAIFSIDKSYDYDPVDQVGESTKIDSRGYNVNCNNIDYIPGLNGGAELYFSGGAGARAVERFLSAIYLNGN
ncbi:MAG: hypothetical protein RL641_601 [Candidatus Parcubacteria bacterium]|jgi:hypothetical protein